MSTRLTPQHVESYARDGVICVRNAVSSAWTQRMLRVADEQLDAPGRWCNDANPGQRNNRMFTDRYLWRDNAEVRAFVFESGVAQLAAEAMGSRTARFYFDHLLIKEPATTTPTPWHQDTPYWPFRGSQICSVWVALSPASVEESALEFVLGSHRDGNYYLPQVFGERDNHPNSWQREGMGVPVPPIEQNRADYAIGGWDVEAGDALVFSAWMLHGARGNASATRRRAAISTRWLGDDSSWFPHPGTDPTVTQEHTQLAPGQYPADDDRFPLGWPPAAERSPC